MQNYGTTNINDKWQMTNYELQMEQSLVIKKIKNMNPYILPGLKETVYNKMTNNEISNIIFDIVERITDVKYLDIVSKRRFKNFVFARQMVATFLRKYTNLSEAACGDYINIEHATVIHSIRTIKNYMIYPDKASVINKTEELIKINLGL